MQSKITKRILLVCAVGVCFLVVLVGSQNQPMQQLLTQCMDYTPPPCYRATSIIRDCCIYMGPGRYIRERWIVGIWRHPQAPRSVWYRREYRVSSTGEACTPMQQLICRAIGLSRDKDITAKQ